LIIIVLAAVVGSIVYAMLPKPVPVDLATVETGPLEVTVDDDGKTRIKERYDVSTPLSGRLLRITLDPGDSVVAGKTVLARIEPTDPELLDPRALAEAEARVKAAEARLAQAGPNLEKALAAMQFAEAELARVRQAHEKGAATQDDLDTAILLDRTRTQEYRSAKFTEEIARFELQMAKAALLRTKPDGEASVDDWFFEIRSPITGRVLRVFEESETVVAAGARLLELGDPADLEVEIDVLSSDAVKIEPGDRVYLEQWGGEAPLNGTVRIVEPSGFTKISALGVEEQRVNVIVDFTDPPEERESLHDGFRVEARIVIWEQPNVLKVPTSALFREKGDWAVFVVDDGHVRLQTIQVGRRNDLEAAVLEGLQAGDRVVVHPSDRVADGVAIEPR
jgi:HlyD family secretion protein